MGVKTFCWGPPAWIVLHSCANELDIRPNSDLEKTFWKILPEILPCVHCRISTKKFLSMYLHPDNSTNKLFRNRQQMYCLHQMVNCKLFSQEVIGNVGGIESIVHILKKWCGYQPRFQDVQYVKPDSYNFVKALISFLYYIVCDVDDTRKGHIEKFFYILGQIFENNKFGKVWEENVIQAEVPNKDHLSDNLSQRIRFVFDIEKIVKKKLNFHPPMHIENRQEICKLSIVGCHNKKI